MSDRILPESAKTPFYPALDGVRTVAILLVFGVHFMVKLFPFGWIGVQLFFVLSGFLITGILFDTSGDKHRYRNFYVRRALRIFPLYYAFLFAVCAVCLLTHGRPVAKLWLWFCYLQNFFWILSPPSARDAFVTGTGHVFAVVGHLWSLAVEEQFYLLWPPIVFWVRDRRRLMQLSCVLIVLRILLAAYWQLHLPPETLQKGLIYRMLPTQADAFLMGGLLALWWRGKPSLGLQSVAGWIAAAAIVFYAALLSLLHLFPGMVGGQNVFAFTSAFQAIAGLPLVDLVSTLFLLAVLLPGTWAHTLCALKPMRSLGRVSYGLYVFHLSVFALTDKPPLNFFSHLPHGLRGFGHSIQTTAVTVLLSYASYYFFERHFLLLKNRFTSVPARGDRNVAVHSL